MVISRFQPGASGWKAQTNPRSYHGPFLCQYFCRYLHRQDQTYFLGRIISTTQVGYSNVCYAISSRNQRVLVHKPGNLPWLKLFDLGLSGQFGHLPIQQLFQLTLRKTSSDLCISMLFLHIQFALPFLATLMYLIGSPRGTTNIRGEFKM